MMTLTGATLKNVIFQDSYSSFKKTFMIFAGVFLLAMASQLSIPLIPVPLTFQSAMVVFIGMALGARYGAYVVATYLFLGSVGVPVFADYSAGFMTFFHPTGGYLIGFLPAVLICGYLSEKGFAKNVLTSFVAALIGASIIFFFGVMVLSTFVGFKPAIALGLMPFVVSEPIKLIVVSLIIPRFWKSNTAK